MEPVNPKQTMIDRGGPEGSKRADQLRRDEQQKRAEAARKLATSKDVPPGKGPPAAA